MKKILFTIFGLALFGVILFSNSATAPLFICFAVAIISIHLVWFIDGGLFEYLKDRLAYLVAQIIIRYRKKWKCK